MKNAKSLMTIAAAFADPANLLDAIDIKKPVIGAQMRYHGAVILKGATKGKRHKSQKIRSNKRKASR